MMHQQITVLDAPSNLCLRPSELGCVPGCYKLPWALRDCQLLALLGANDGGALTPPRYCSEWQLGDADRNVDAIATASLVLADRVGNILDAQHFPLVLGDDYSILIGNVLALKRRGRYGVVLLDAHTERIIRCLQATFAHTGVASSR